MIAPGELTGSQISQYVVIDQSIIKRRHEMAKKTQEPEGFDQKVNEIVQRTLIDFIAKGDWLKIDYSARVPVDLSLLRRVYDRVNMNRVVDLVKERVEEKMADTIMHSMSTEITHDVKSIMSNRELREDIRSAIRTKIRQVHSAISE